MNPSQTRRSRPDRTLAGLLVGALLVPPALGVSTTTVALPSLTADLDLSRPGAAWVLAAYVLAQAMFVAIFGRVGDVRGVRVVLLAGAGLVAAGSAAAAFAPSLPLLLAGRALQGAGAGAAPVAAYAIVAAHFDGTDRARVLAIGTAMVGIVSGAGSLIGGLLTDGGSWHVVVAVPGLSLLATAAAFHLAPGANAAGTRLDALGALLVAALASAIVLLLQTPSLQAGAAVPLAAGAVALVSAAALVQRVRTVPTSFVPAPIARSPQFVLAALAGLTLFSGYLGTLFAAPQLLLQHHDWSATQIGLVLLPAAVTGALGARIAGRLLVGHDAFRLAAGFAAISAGGLLVAAVADGAPAWTVLALGMTLSAFTAGQVALIGRVPLTVEPQVRSVATGLFTLMMWLGGAVGSALVAGLADPLGLGGALGVVALLPATGALLALAAGAVGAVGVPTPAWRKRARAGSL